MEEKIKARIAALEKQREALIANINAHDGAIAELRALLVPKPEEPNDSAT